MENNIKTIFHKPDDYYSDDRRDIASLIEQGNNSILEIGCGKGNTGIILREKNKASKLAGIEINPDIATAAEKISDLVICGDVEKMDLPVNYGPYDYVICGDGLDRLFRE